MASFHRRHRIPQIGINSINWANRMVVEIKVFRVPCL
jgi:hypothetical protein